MRSLKDILKESILDDIDTQIEKGDDAIKDEIMAFLNENYEGTFKISKKPNTDGLYKVSSTKDVEVTNKNITSLTNGMFVWSKINGDFVCFNCSSLESLEGAPEKIGGDFDCSRCNSLTSLEGAPKEVGKDFDCRRCESLTSLEGAPEKVGRDFDCASCNSLISLEGAPKEVENMFICVNCKSLKSLKGAPEKIGGDFDCFNCPSLKSLEGAPKEVGGDFGYDKQFTEDDVKKVSNVKGKIFC